jgi:hypothetical protein
MKNDSFITDEIYILTGCTNVFLFIDWREVKNGEFYIL